MLSSAKSWIVSRSYRCEGYEMAGEIGYGFDNPYGCDDCDYRGCFCPLHDLYDRGKVKPMTGPELEDCGYCRRRGEPCKRHGGTDSQASQKEKPISWEGYENTTGELDLDDIDFGEGDVEYAVEHAHEQEERGREYADDSKQGNVSNVNRNVNTELEYTPDGGVKMVIRTKSVEIVITEEE